MNRYARRAIAAHTEPAPEATFQRTVLELAEWRGWPLRFHVQNSRRSAPGFPDLILVKPGRMVALELKSARGKPSVEQLAWIGALDTVPGIDARIAYPADLQSIAELLS